MTYRSISFHSVDFWGVMRFNGDMDEKAPKPKKVGCGPAIIFGIILVLLIGAGSNEVLGHYFSECPDTDDIVSCMLDWSEEPEPEGAVTAAGVYTYKDYSATLTLHIPLEGGTVTGTITGVCDGTVTGGTFSGQNNGAISGKLAGSCDPFFVKIPASGSFSGTVNKDSKVVPITVTGTGGGINRTDSMSLSY